MLVLAKHPTKYGLHWRVYLARNMRLGELEDALYG